MRVLVVDVGGTNVKILVSGESQSRKIPSGSEMTPEEMIRKIREQTTDWPFDVVSLGYPGVVHRGRIVEEPHNLASGWIDFDFAAAFGCPVKVINDAAMQALGGYVEGTLLFLGLGTGLGAALVVDGTIVPTELAHLSYEDGEYEDYLGREGMERLGKKHWERHVRFVVAQLIRVFHPDDVLLGGGNTKKLKAVPPGCRTGDNTLAMAGGFRMWEGARP